MTRASDTARLVSGGAVINEASNDVDFRVESNGNTHALFVDAGNDKVGIKEDSPSCDFVVKQNGSTFTTASQTVGLFQRNSATGSGCKVTILSGNASSGDLNFGDAEDEDIGKLAYEHNNNAMTFTTNASERMRIDSSGNVLVGTTDNNPNNNSADSTDDNGTVIFPTGLISIATHQNAVMVANRTGNDGNLFDLRRSGATKGKIDVGSSSIAIFATGVNNGGWSFGDGAAILPMKDSALADNNMDLGSSSNRMDDIFATNSTIQTSDQNEKQDIASATTKELNVAKKLSALFKTFRWKDKVAEKGDKARTHTGIVAQEVQSAFKAEGLDASNYGLFTSDTWWEKEIKVDAVKADEEKGIEAKDAYTYIDTKDEKTDGYTERTRLGVRYPELFSFIFSSIEARLSALESK